MLMTPYLSTCALVLGKQKAHLTRAANSRTGRVRRESTLTSLLQPIYLLLRERHFAGPGVARPLKHSLSETGSP
jgi:hypothetical protein